jgi:hypothetical protein
MFRKIRTSKLFKHFNVTQVYSLNFKKLKINAKNVTHLSRIVLTKKFKKFKDKRVCAVQCTKSFD